LKKKKPTYLGRKSFFHGGEFPIHSGQLLKANCLAPLAFSLTPLLPLPAYRAFILTYKDDINRPDSSVGHINVMTWEGDIVFGLLDMVVKFHTMTPPLHPHHHHNLHQYEIISGP
jgi:hypothetical protein